MAQGDDRPERAAGPLAGAEEPGNLTFRSLRYLLVKTFREFLGDKCPDLAAGLTYYAIFAVAPSLLVLVSLLGLLGDADRIVDRVMVAVTQVAPDVEVGTVRTIVENLTRQQGAGIALVGGIVVALWSASAYVNAFGRAMNQIHEVDEGRPIWKLRPIMLLITLVILLLAVTICVALVLTGPVARMVGALVGLSDEAVVVWGVVKWPVVLMLVVLIVAILYWATPNVRQGRFRWLSAGAGVAIALWILATAGFGFYLSRFGSYDATYGALAGVIVFVLWLWITNNALLLGAELDVELERVRQLRAGIPAEETVRLALRDTKAIESRRAKEADDVAAGRALRLAAHRRRSGRDEESRYPKP